MDVIGDYDERPFLKTRNAHIDTLNQGGKKHHIPILFEADVTNARMLIRETRERTGERLSFTGWIVGCLARAVGEHPQVHAMRRGGGSLVTFRDVDVSITVERSVPGGDGVETIPMPYVIRGANGKGVREIHREIRQAQERPVQAGEAFLGGQYPGWMIELFLSLPGTLRSWVMFRRLVKDPFFAKRMMGTVVVTSVGTAGRTGGSLWVIPTGIHPLVLAVGGIAERPVLVESSIQLRESLSLTVLFDHDVVDGSPVVRFIARLQQLLESAFGLRGVASPEDAAEDRGTLVYADGRDGVQHEHPARSRPRC